MKLSKRRWFGLGLICLSATAAFFILGDWVVGGGNPVAFIPASQNVSMANGSWLGYATIRVQINPYIYLLFLAGFIVGLGCLFWPDHQKKVTP